MSQTVQQTFDRLADEYDRVKLLLIPGYVQMQEIVNRYASECSPQRVLELGCGTGQWAATFLQNYPGATYTGIEFSERMLSIASGRLARFKNRVELLKQDLNISELAIESDLVVSFFTVHHVLDKQNLIHKLFERLSPGGCLLYADVTKASHPELEQIYIKSWMNFMSRNGLTTEQIEGVLADHHTNDMPLSPATQVNYLGEAGFKPADVIWQHEKFAVFFGLRPER